MTNTPMNIDKKLDEVFGSIAKDIINYDFVEIVDNKELKRCLLIEQANFRKYMLDQIPKIKQLFQELAENSVNVYAEALIDLFTNPPAEYGAAEDLHFHTHQIKKMIKESVKHINELKLLEKI